MVRDLALTTGDPHGEFPASFSRFVLPFIYSPHVVSTSDPISESLSYQPIEGFPGAFRRQYLTMETSAALYDRALWLELKRRPEAEAAQFTVPSKSGNLTVEVANPRLALFEWCAGNVPQDANGSGHDPLRTGFLMIDFFFPDPGATLDDLLAVNEHFRFWLRPYEGHGEKSDSEYARYVGGFPAVLAKLTGIDNIDPRNSLHIGRWAPLLELQVAAPGGQIFRLFPDEWREQARVWAGSGKGKTGWVAYSDPRAYVWTCALLEDGSRALVDKQEDDPAKTGHWVRLLNVDRPSADEPSEFEKKWADGLTYRRWEHDSTLYGFNVHAGVMLAKPKDEPPVWRHFAEEYFDQTLLVLYLKVACFQFSRWLSEASTKVRDDRRHRTGHRDPVWEQDLRTLRERFAHLANVYEFPLLSNHQQGIELYERAVKAVNLRTLMKEIRQQVEASHEFLEILADLDEATSARRLGIVATIGLGFALATGFFGMNFLGIGYFRGEWSWAAAKEWVAFVAVLLIALILLALGAVFADTLTGWLDRCVRWFRRKGRSGRQARQGEAKG